MTVEERARAQLKESARNLLEYRREGRTWEDYNLVLSRDWFYCLAHILEVERLPSERGDEEAFYRFVARMAAEEEKS